MISPKILGQFLLGVKMNLPQQHPFCSLFVSVHDPNKTHILCFCLTPRSRSSTDHKSSIRSPPRLLITFHPKKSTVPEPNRRLRKPVRPHPHPQSASTARRPPHLTGRSPETGCAPSAFGASFRSIHDSRVTGTTFPRGPSTPDIPLITAAATPRIAATNPQSHHCRTFIPATLQLPFRPVKSFSSTLVSSPPRLSRVCPESAHDKSVNPGIMPRGSARSPAAASLLRHHAGGFRPSSRRQPRPVRAA